MTAELLKRLAELNDAAFDFYQRSNKPMARRFQDAARAATLLAGQLVAEEQQATIQLGLDKVKAELSRRVA